jgi:hypothetical protein
MHQDLLTVVDTGADKLERAGVKPRDE